MTMVTKQGQRIRGIVQDIEVIKQSMGQNMDPERATSTSQQGRASQPLDIAENVIYADIQTQEIEVQLVWQPRLVAAEIVIAPATTCATIAALHFSTDSWECSSGPTPAWQSLNKPVILQLVSAMTPSQYRSPIFSLPGI